MLDRPQYWLPQPSRTFHGRDIFAPIAARLASGAAPVALGTLVDDPITLPLSVAASAPGTRRSWGASCTWTVLAT